MRKRLSIDLKNLRERVPDDYVIEDYPVELLVGFRAPVGKPDRGWQALAFDPSRLNYERLRRRGALDVVFHHAESGLMVVSPSLSSGLHWRVIYPGDGVLCAHSIFMVAELLTVRYEVAPPSFEWAREILDLATPWHANPGDDPTPRIDEGLG